jgi:predicted transcriptional regulator
VSKVILVRLSDELLAKLDRLAESVERPRSWLIEQAIERYVEDEAWQVAAIRKAYEDYKAGRSVLIPHEQVMAELDAQIRARRGVRAEDLDDTGGHGVDR